MIPEAIISLILLLIISGFYFLYIKPSKRAKRYVRDFERAGYKVYKFTFNPLDYPFFSTIFNDSKKGDPLKTYKQKFESYDILVGNAFNKTAISFISPAARKQFAKNEIDYAYIKLPFIIESMKLIIGKGLVFSEGEQWKRKRRIVSSLFNYQFLNKKVPEIVEICRSCLYQNELQSKTQKIQGLTSNKQQYQFHLIKLTSRIFSNIILSLFLGTQSLQEKLDGKKLCHFTMDLISEYNERMNQSVPFILGPKYFKLGLTQIDRDLYRRKEIFNKWATSYIDNIIQKLSISTNKDKNVNLLQLLYDSNKGKQNSYSKQELIDELKTFFFAGTDTTSHLVEMMIYYTAINKSILKNVREEIDSFKGQICSIEDLKKLKYIEAIQKQTIRYYGPVPLNFSRVTIKDHLINGVQISEGTVVQYHSATTHFDPKYYQNPFEFNPDRWLNQNKQFDSACLTGFGMGSRSCIGQQLANIQSRIALFYFFRRYKEIKVPKQIVTRWKFMNQAQDLWVKVQKQ